MNFNELKKNQRVVLLSQQGQTLSESGISLKAVREEIIRPEKRDETLSSEAQKLIQKLKGLTSIESTSSASSLSGGFTNNNVPPKLSSAGNQFVKHNSSSAVTNKQVREDLFEDVATKEELRLFTLSCVKT